MFTHRCMHTTQHSQGVHMDLYTHIRILRHTLHSTHTEHTWSCVYIYTHLHIHWAHTNLYIHTVSCDPRESLSPGNLYSPTPMGLTHLLLGLQLQHLQPSGFSLLTQGWPPCAYDCVHQGHHCTPPHEASLLVRVHHTTSSFILLHIPLPQFPLTGMPHHGAAH